MPPVIAAAVAHPFIALGLGAATAATATTMSSAMNTNIPETSPASTVDVSDTLKKSQEQAQAANRQRALSARRSRSIYSSPLGIGGEASTIRKILLGQ